ncbi:MAG: rhodanese-like domain-containing protein [Paracoccaceae bacterium]|jgi:rhodanese-related sulfurtransferase|nr:rhodanese-like domain-containing protein [Paracoccaceae bacterium]
MKTSKDYVVDANSVVQRMSAEDAVKHHGDGSTLFLDVRDSSEIAESGTIKGALCVNRGILEFAADEKTPYFKKELKKAGRIFVLCAAGGRAALAGKTLQEMGYSNVFNIGGFKQWQAAGGDVQ